LKERDDVCKLRQFSEKTQPGAVAAEARTGKTAFCNEIVTSLRAVLI